jgi:hypothetical protein
MNWLFPNIQSSQRGKEVEICLLLSFFSTFLAAQFHLKQPLQIAKADLLPLGMGFDEIGCSLLIVVLFCVMIIVTIMSSLLDKNILFPENQF